MEKKEERDKGKEERKALKRHFEMTIERPNLALEEWPLAPL